MLRGSFPSGFSSTSWFLVIVAFLACPGLPIVAPWVSWPVLLSICVRRSSSPRNVCRTLCCLSYILPGASSRALLQQVATQVALCPAGVGASRWFVEVCLCMALSCKAFLLHKKKNAFCFHVLLNQVTSLTLCASPCTWACAWAHARARRNE